jgi:hypothetical protein
MGVLIYLYILIGGRRSYELYLGKFIEKRKNNTQEAWLPGISFVYSPCCDNEVTALNKGYVKFNSSKKKRFSNVA